MARIVAGRFDRSVDADAALDALKREGFSRAEVDAFYVGPPGQNARTPIGGDVHSDAGAVGAGRSGALGAAIGAAAGLIVGALIGFNEALFACGLGALVGAFAGVLSSLHGASRREHTPEHPADRPESRGGRVIAICVEREGTEVLAVNALRANNARDVGRTEGDWRDGSWRDFDPRAPLATV